MVENNCPLVSLVLACYHPQTAYLVKQLQSLDRQTYSNLELVVVDDSASDEAYETIQRLLEEQITSFPYRLFRNELNRGSTKSFESALLHAKGSYISFCDQDDDWYPEKTKKLLQAICKDKALLAYSDMHIMDGNDHITHLSAHQKNRRISSVQGAGLFPFFLQRNAVTGCSMMVERKLALLAIPFAEQFYYHDHWLALFAASKGKISYVNQALLAYRIHGENQVGLRILDKIKTKEDYCRKLEKSIERMDFLLQVFNEEESAIQSQKENLKTRLFAFQNGPWGVLFTKRNVYGEDWLLWCFESIYAILPAGMARVMLSLVRRI
ncbi:glycosyltransferase [Clostridia bacterium]|nr:glycosyltransferase [Clostridia bacterium]